MKRKKKREQKYNELLSSIHKYSKHVPLYNIFLDKGIQQKTNSIYNQIEYQIENHTKKQVYTFKNDINHEEIKKIVACDKIILSPTDKQKKQLLSMLEGYKIIYNETIKFFKTRLFNYKKETKVIPKEKVKKPRKKKGEKEVELIINSILDEIFKDEDIEIKKRKRVEKIEKQKNDYSIITDYKIIKTYFLKNKIHEISEKYNTPVHCLNYAVKLACSSYKSCLSNLRNKNIKHFRLRYLKQIKPSMIMDIEKQTIKETTFYPSLLGPELINKQNIKYSNKNDCKIHYNIKKDEFTMLVPKVINKTPLINNNWISIDPGIRTFLSCKTQDNFLEIGTNLNEKLRKKIKLIDKQEYNKERQNKTRQKIKNWINDTHWKIINYLTSSFKSIIIGKWSTKDIIKKGDSILTKLTKRVSQSLLFYSFLQKLRYKCTIKEINLRIQDEWYTSKTCSCCGWKNENLGGNKVFNCKQCKISIDRDYNGARNIMLKSLEYINVVP